MNARTGFFSWWLGELGDAFSGRQAPSLALALSDTEIALIERGLDAPLGVVEVSAPDRMERIETLRAIAERRVGRPPEVELRLPPDQVLFRVEEFSPEANLRAAARGRLESMIGRLESELCFDVSEPERGKPLRATVAVATLETVEDALAYARSWGFKPVRVSAIESPRAFPRGPDFIRTETAASRSPAPRIAAAMGVIACALLAAAGARALGARTETAETVRAQAERAAPPAFDMETRELALGRYAHAASMAIEERASAAPVWRIVSEAARALPRDAALTAMRYEPGRLRLEGEAASIEALAESMERSVLFAAPRFAETSAKSDGVARFVLDLSVEEIGSR